MPTSPLKFELLLSEWVLGLIPPEDVPGLAVKLLEDGCASTGVAILAGLQRPTRGDVDSELPRLLHELDATRPTELQALKTLVDDCAERIVAGTLPPVLGAERIAEVWHAGFGPDEYPLAWLDVAALIGVDGQSKTVTPPGRRANRPDTLEQARALVRRGGLNIRPRIGAGQLDGRVVAHCQVQEHVLDGVRTPVRLGLEFADGVFIAFGAAPGGASLQLGCRALRDYDLGEHGRIVVRAEGFPCNVLRPGTTLETVIPLPDRADLDIGVRIGAGQESVYVLTVGESLAIQRSPPARELRHPAP